MATTVQKTDKELLQEAKDKEARRLELAAKRAEDREKRAGETKAAAFTRIATRRTNQALDAISLIRGLSVKANYEYSPEQSAAILTALRAEVDKVEKDFAQGGPVRNDSGFTL